MGWPMIVTKWSRNVDEILGIVYVLDVLDEVLLNFAKKSSLYPYVSTGSSLFLLH